MIKNSKELSKYQILEDINLKLTHVYSLIDMTVTCMEYDDATNTEALYLTFDMIKDVKSLTNDLARAER